MENLLEFYAVTDKMRNVKNTITKWVYPDNATIVVAYIYLKENNYITSMNRPLKSILNLI